MQKSSAPADHLSEELRRCAAEMQMLSDRAEFAADPVKFQTCRELLDEVREERRRVEAQLAAKEPEGDDENSAATRVEPLTRQRTSADFSDELP